MTSVAVANPNRLEAGTALPLLPTAPPPAEDKARAIHDRIVAPLRSRWELAGEAFKKVSWRWGLGGVATSAVLCAVLASEAVPDPSANRALVLGGGALVAGLGAALQTASEAFVPTLARDADRKAAKKDAVKVLADAITNTTDQPWSKVVDRASVSRSGTYVRLEFSPRELGKLTAAQRAELIPSIIASLPESVRVLAPFVKIDSTSAHAAAQLHKPGFFATYVVPPLAGFAGLVGGVVSGAAVGGACGLALGAVGGIIAFFIGTAAITLTASPVDFGSMVAFCAAIVGFPGLVGAGLTAIAGAFAGAGTASAEAIRFKRTNTSEFQEKAAKLLVPHLRASRSLLPPQWQACIGNIGTIADERGNVAISISKSGAAATMAGDADQLKAAFADTLPEPMRLLLAKMPFYFGTTPVPAKPTWTDLFVKLCTESGATQRADGAAPAPAAA